MKYELNRSYIGGGGVYLLQSELSTSTLQYCMNEKSDHKVAYTVI